MRNINVSDVCCQYGYCIDWLPSSTKKGWITKEILRQMKDAVDRLRPMLCKKLGFPINTGWKRIAGKCGINFGKSERFTKEESVRRHLETFKIELDSKEIELYEKLDSIRYTITGML